MGLKVSEVSPEMTGPATQEYQVVVKVPGVSVGNQPEKLWTIGRAYRDTSNGRLVLEVDEVIDDGE